MKHGWKVTRFVTSALMSLAAAGLVSTCSTCTNEIGVNNSTSAMNIITRNSTNSTVAITYSSIDSNALNTVAKVCFTGGFLYGGVVQ
ncbi:hypothetical protein [Candidatus Clavichlamydia salmonicola]|uniref:hypothetical protein n=1 Tax=Candidatus Clavichlamydia salmonicola TaxID=469812 RepID=UPI0018919F6C|nr:hypothetical protein [Candidatus Clavichlamydia salmonicola]